MANMKLRRTGNVRSDPDWKKWCEEMARWKSYQEKENISPSRITQAVFNLRKKYPIDDEIKLSKLGKWK